jgi:threonine synthase
MIEPLIGERIDIPPALAELLRRPASAEPIPPSDAALRAHLLRPSNFAPATRPSL